jgi:hypothetical protein
VTWELWIPLLVALITVTGGIMTWSLTERARRAQEEYSRREARYSALVGTLHGFYVDTTSPELRGKFIAELELAWLYCPDDVIRKGYGFLNSVQVGSKATEAEQKLALGEFVSAIRQDLLSRERVRTTALKPSEFQTLGPTMTGGRK